MRSTHKVSGDDLSNWVSWLFEQETAILVDADKPSCQGAICFLHGYRLTEVRGASQPPGQRRPAIRRDKGVIGASEALEQVLKHLIRRHVDTGGRLDRRRPRRQSLRSTEDIDADANQCMVDAIAAQARRDKDSGDFGCAASRAEPDVVRPLQPNDTARNALDRFGDCHSRNEWQR